MSEESMQRDIVLINELLSNNSEVGCVEFKHNYATLCERFGIDKKNAAQASVVIKKTLEAKFIKVADPEHPRGGYEPIWA